MSKVMTFLPLATTTVAAERANSSAASRPLRTFVASVVSPETDQPCFSRNSRDFVQPVQPLRWYIQSIEPGMGSPVVGPVTLTPTRIALGIP